MGNVNLTQRYSASTGVIDVDIRRLRMQKDLKNYIDWNFQEVADTF